jgi:hypothetical protein
MPAACGNVRAVCVTTSALANQRNLVDVGWEFWMKKDIDW